MCTHLAADGAEVVSVLQGSQAHLAAVSVVVTLLLLWPLPEEDNRGLIDGVGL